MERDWTVETEKAGRVTIGHDERGAFVEVCAPTSPVAHRTYLTADGVGSLSRASFELARVVANETQGAAR